MIENLEADILSWMISQGLMSDDGTLLIDAEGNPLDIAPPGTTPEDSNTLNLSYAEAWEASKDRGETNEQWENSPEFKKFQDDVLGQINANDDVDALSENLAWHEANIAKGGDLAANSQVIANATKTRLDLLANPLKDYLDFDIGGTNKTDAVLLEQQKFLYDQAQQSYKTLQNFQLDQTRATDALSDQIRMSREFSIPKSPEKSGSFTAGGASARANAERTGISDLLIRI